MKRERFLSFCYRMRLLCIISAVFTVICVLSGNGSTEPSVVAAWMAFLCGLIGFMAPLQFKGMDALYEKLQQFSANHRNQK